MQILDTQIISYAYKGIASSIAGKSIASVTAKEFLLAQEDERNKASYYFPLLSQFAFSIGEDLPFPEIEHPFSKRNTDQIIINLGSGFPIIIQHGNLAITAIINSKARGLFRQCVRYMEKAKRKMLLDKFDFLIDNEVSCVPLDRNSTTLGVKLFYDFITQFNTKNNIRNTVNDILILAIAVETSATLVSQDSVLNRFAANYFDASVKSDNVNVCIEFRKLAKPSNATRQESKGYINSSWRIRTKNYNVT